MLPSPSKWAPDAVIKYIDSKETKAIQRLGELAEELDNKWLNFREGTYSNFIAGLEPDGFREIKWGQHISTVLGMTKFKASWLKSYSENFYIRNNEDLSMGNAKLDYIVYYFPEGRFCSVFIKSNGNSNWEALREKLIKDFGNEGTFTENVCYWYGYRCTIDLSYEKSSDSITIEISHHRC